MSPPSGRTRWTWHSRCENHFNLVTVEKYSDQMVEICNQHNASLPLMHNKKSVLPLHAILFYPWNWQVSWHSSPVRTPKNTSITLSLEHQSLTHLLNDPLTCLGRSGHPCGHSWHQAAAGSLLQLRLQHVAAWLLPPFRQIEHILEFLLNHFRSHQIKGATGEQWPIVKPFQRGSPSKDFKMQSCVFQATSRSPWCPESARPCGLLLLGSPTEGWQAK